MRHVPLEDALKLVYLYAEKESPRYEKAAMKFLRRYLDEKEPTLKNVAKVVRRLEGRSKEPSPERSRSPSAPRTPGASSRRSEATSRAREGAADRGARAGGGRAELGVADELTRLTFRCSGSKVAPRGMGEGAKT